MVTTATEAERGVRRRARVQEGGQGEAAGQRLVSADDKMLAAQDVGQLVNVAGSHGGHEPMLAPPPGKCPARWPPMSARWGAQPLITARSGANWPGHAAELLSRPGHG